MNTRKEALELFERMLWIEKEMKDSYSTYKNIVSDQVLRNTMGNIENDESRHINMVENLIAILRKRL